MANSSGETCGFDMWCGVLLCEKSKHNFLVGRAVRRSITLNRLAILDLVQGGVTSHICLTEGCLCLVDLIR